MPRMHRKRVELPCLVPPFAPRVMPATPATLPVVVKERRPRPILLPCVHPLEVPHDRLDAVRTSGAAPSSGCLLQDFTKPLFGDRGGPLRIQRDEKLARFPKRVVARDGVGDEAGGRPR